MTSSLCACLFIGIRCDAKDISLDCSVFQGHDIKPSTALNVKEKQKKEAKIFPIISLLL